MHSFNVANLGAVHSPEDPQTCLLGHINYIITEHERRDSKKNIDVIVARGLVRNVAAGTASHSAHAKHLAHTLLKFSRGEAPDYGIKSEDKFFAVLDRVGIVRDGKSNEELAGELAQLALDEFSLNKILTRIVQGQGSLEDLHLLEEVSEMVSVGSLCGLGQTAPNPVFSTLRYFRKEYETHVIEKRCPSGICKMTVEV